VILTACLPNNSATSGRNSENVWTKSFTAVWLEALVVEVAQDARVKASAMGAARFVGLADHNQVTNVSAGDGGVMDADPKGTLAPGDADLTPTRRRHRQNHLMGRGHLIRSLSQTFRSRLMLWWL